MNSWNITLPPDLAKFVNDQLACKAWDSADMMFAAAISGLQHAIAVDDSIDKDWLRAQIQIGIEQADRGELLEEDEVFDDILNDLREPVQKTT